MLPGVFCRALGNAENFKNETHFENVKKFLRNRFSENAVRDRASVFWGSLFEISNCSKNAQVK